MKDEATGLTEADITINGRLLSFAESMSVRVAIGSFRLSLTDHEMRRGLGARLAHNYDHHLEAVERLILER